MDHPLAYTRDHPGHGSHSDQSSKDHPWILEHKRQNNLTSHSTERIGYTRYMGDGCHKEVFMTFGTPIVIHFNTETHERQVWLCI